jgi:hypothetical protein
MNGIFYSDRRPVFVPMLLAALAACAVATVTAQDSPGPVPHVKPPPPKLDRVTFRKVALDKSYRAEGVSVVDVNRDGKLDIMAGNLWYEGPDWKPHEIAAPLKLDPAVDKSNCYVNYAEDLNGDGWVDQMLVGRPGTKASWRENPKGKEAPWAEHPLWPTACNESPAYTDILGDGKRVLVFAYDNSVMAWYEPGKDPAGGFVAHRISEDKAPGTDRYAHGLGVGDINGDGRKDVLVREGYWEAPSDRRSSPWKFVPADLGPECAHMYVVDFNGDGLNDVISSSAHNIGVWWYEQKRGANGPEFVQHQIDNTYSQSHAMAMGDINGDGRPDFVTGKRFWAHGPKGDINPNDPAVLVWYEYRQSGGKVEWLRHQIDDDSGVGINFEIRDVNADGLPDIITSNRKGVHLFLQERR